MKIIPEQISVLREKEVELTRKYEEYKEYLKNRETIGCEETTISQVGDSVIEGQYQRDIDELNEIRKILTTADYVTERPTDQIGIGTKFVIKFTGDKSTHTITLTEYSSALTGLYKFISTASPVGTAVFGKQAGEEFKAIIEGDHSRPRRVSTGTIESIETDQDAYLHFIREKKFHNRRSKQDKEEYQAIKELPEDEQQAKLEERFAITESQRNLLLVEKERECRKSKKSRRLTRIDKILNSSPRAVPPTDGTIGIGSTFDIIIGDGENAETRHYEYINSAVSDELEDAYLEKISTFGGKFYGLKVGDTVSFHHDYREQTAKVINVEVPEKTNAGPQLSKK